MLTARWSGTLRQRASLAGFAPLTADVRPARPQSMSTHPLSRFLAALALSMLVSLVHAEWSKLPPSADGTVQYVDTSSIERSGAMVRMTWLNDLPNPRYVRVRKSSKTWSSQIFQAEYNCAKQEYRIVRLTLFSGQMAEGESFPSSTTGQWRAIPGGKGMWGNT